MGTTWSSSDYNHDEGFTVHNLPSWTNGDWLINRNVLDNAFCAVYEEMVSKPYIYFVGLTHTVIPTLDQCKNNTTISFHQHKGPVSNMPRCQTEVTELRVNSNMYYNATDRDYCPERLRNTLYHELAHCIWNHVRNANLPHTQNVLQATHPGHNDDRWLLGPTDEFDSGFQIQHDLLHGIVIQIQPFQGDTPIYANIWRKEIRETETGHGIAHWYHGQLKVDGKWLQDSPFQIQGNLLLCVHTNNLTMRHCRRVQD
eukprot:TRINITY_DN37096_c0_g1_i1.p1 TRINITY_DN37096_c0_g1~~TRINITY_DN37096_c0_g1_i1.p1  ORF type:complete len:272 (-),score=2.85 TRINITY_DN37096_c0_g1_i1:213-980(-)